ncbi:hypothetical protein RO3G_11560 [Rhizopus delemar RA 99-880]|uniref:Uncharacterized protein n=1 Tax=Rhizopus delemar (strain RA 99-880 / ATCC MYA-4621 / FGSC 9543 / NRRL 43880) TaxID=246409 RepID=I1CEG9_RHIO9|nr:hypothetical protein RO3G_11560 [Rhizopus delemar RA 99-880]|eukprot:EIE86849.1 hypothetical protein RO3G_11560 [Rhizopus delemar RA 99-880]
MCVEFKLDEATMKIDQMKSLVLLKEDDKGNIHDEIGAETMKFVDEKPHPYALKQLVN